jgi:hypothetical protein
MKDIDFLPARYREQNAQRRVQLWRVSVLALFVAGVGATAAGQYTFRRAARQHLEAVSPQHSAARAKSEQHTQLQQQLKEVQATTQLYAYLQHPWPRTQIFAEVAERLPPTLTLSELRLLQEAVAVESNEVRRARRPRGREGTDEESKEKLPAAVRDLKRLREEHDAARTIVEVSGQTHDIAALHAYLGKLSESPLFARCELSSLEALTEGKTPADSTRQSRFKLRLALRPGYGQPGSPTVAPASAGVATVAGANNGESE